MVSDLALPGAVLPVARLLSQIVDNETMHLVHVYQLHVGVAQPKSVTYINCNVSPRGVMHGCQLRQLVIHNWLGCLNQFKNFFPNKT